MMIVGTIVKPPVVLDNGNIYSFDMEVFKYVRDGSKMDINFPDICQRFT
jgi:hypothetical protein